MLFAAVIIIVPFITVSFLSRYDWRLRKISKTETEVHYSKISWWKGAIYLLSLGLLFIAISLYFAVRKITYSNIGILDFIIVFSAFSFLYSKAKKIKLKKKEGSGFYLEEEIRKEDTSVLPAEEIKKENNPASSHNRATPGSYVVDFWKNYKKVSLPFIFLVISLFLGWRYYDQAQKREAACLQLAEYRRSVYWIKYGGETRIFKTQSEAMNYCLKVLK